MLPSLGIIYYSIKQFSVWFCELCRYLLMFACPYFPNLFSALAILFYFWSFMFQSRVCDRRFFDKRWTLNVNWGWFALLLLLTTASQRHLPGTHCQLTFVIVVARQHSRNIWRLSCFMELLICISIFYYFLIFLSNTLCVVLYGAVEHWVSGALANVGDMIWYDMNRVNVKRTSFCRECR